MHTKSLLEPHFGTFGGRSAPPETLRLLREIDRDAELLYVGKGVWILGVVRPTDHRRNAGAALLEDLEQLFTEAGEGSAVVDPELKDYLAGELLEARFTYRGFSKISAYRVEGWPGGAIVADFRIRDWKFRHEFRQIWLDMVKESTGEAGTERKQKKVLENLELNRRSIERHAFRHPHTVSSPAKPRRGSDRGSAWTRHQGVAS